MQSPRLKKQRSREQEKRVAADIGGYVRAGSGSVFAAKGDVVARDQRLLIECKQTEKASYSLKLAVLKKIQKEARMDGKDPLLVVEFQPAGNVKVAGESFVVVDYDWFMDLIRPKEEK